MLHVPVFEIKVFDKTAFSQRSRLHPKGHCHHCLALFLPFSIFDKWFLELTLIHIYLYINSLCSYLSYLISCFSILMSPSNALLTLGIFMIKHPSLRNCCCLPEQCPFFPATSHTPWPGCGDHKALFEHLKFSAQSPGHCQPFSITATACCSLLTNFLCFPQFPFEDANMTDGFLHLSPNSL